MYNIKNLNKSMNAILVVLLSILCLSLPGRADNTITVQGGNSHLVTGYSVGSADVYSVDIYWFDMVFVFDRGKYNPNDGTLTRASEVEGPELGAIDGNINCWYGFNGENNKVIVLNRSNRDIEAKYKSDIYSDVCGTNVKSELYDYFDNDNYIVNIVQSGEDKGWADDDFVDEYDYENRFGEGDTNEDGKIDKPILLDPNTKKIIKASPADGTMYANKVFINITGTPIDTFQ